MEQPELILVNFCNSCKMLYLTFLYSETQSYIILFCEVNLYLLK